LRLFLGNHVATLSRYVGTSFVAGAVAHGAFSEVRSAVTAMIGICAYVIGSIMQARLESTRKHSWVPMIVAGATLAVGIGFFTGGLQHFPDSPQRSVWVVPLGFFLSGLGLHLLARAEDSKVRILDRKVMGYLFVGLLSVMCLSMLAKNFYDQEHAQGADGHDHHSDHHDSHHGDDDHQ
jgi:hypothetical protein